VVGTASPAALRFTNSASSFHTIGVGTTVVLDGPHASFANLSAVTDNQGSLSLLGGATLATGSFTDDGTLVLGAGSTLAVNGVFTESASGTLTEELGGTSSSPTFGSISAKGVTLAGGLTVTSTVVPAVGSSFEIVNNSATSAISGAFVGLPEGSTFTVKVGATTMTFKISYKGGTGNDVVLTRIS
jgi:hypothetical protein